MEEKELYIKGSAESINMVVEFVRPMISKTGIWIADLKPNIKEEED